MQLCPISNSVAQEEARLDEAASWGASEAEDEEKVGKKNQSKLQAPILSGDGAAESVKAKRGQSAAGIQADG